MALLADAIVVLGCRVLPSGTLTSVAARRAEAAANAYLAGTAPLVVASGGRRWGAQIEARAIGAALLRAGVPAEAIALELWSLTTFENAIYSAALLRRLGAARAAIVTCAWHMPRAIQNFAAAGVEAFPLPVESPPASSLQRFYRRGHELVCERLDARRMRQARVLIESAERLGKGRGAFVPEAAIEVSEAKDEAVDADEGDAPFGARR
jgi:uncharacterized SAM-binding protein YcdF (DUF218 family)